VSSEPVTSLRDASAVTKIDDGRYRATLSEHFSVVGRPNGGYLQCIMGGAAAAAAAEVHSPHHDVTAISTQYVGAASGEFLDLHTSVAKVGRSVSFVRVAAFDGDQLTTESLVTLGHVPTGVPQYECAPLFSIAPLEECVSSQTNDGPSIRTSTDMRFDPDCAQWWSGATSKEAEVRAWVRLSDGSGAPWDAHSLLFACDFMPPATFAIGSVGWVPTLQLTSYIRAIPTGEWLRGRQWCQVVADGLADERCELFDENNRLVALSSQLMMCRFPKTV
jgi:acyl-coenzyme A thioesterase PaaI-like protein